jgi:hypothetical protein
MIPITNEGINSGRAGADDGQISKQNLTVNNQS